MTGPGHRLAIDKGRFAISKVLKNMSSCQEQHTGLPTGNAGLRQHDIAAWLRAQNRKTGDLQGMQAPVLTEPGQERNNLAGMPG